PGGISGKIRLDDDASAPAPSRAVMTSSRLGPVGFGLGLGSPATPASLDGRTGLDELGPLDAASTSWDESSAASPRSVETSSSASGGAMFTPELHAALSHPASAADTL